MNIAEIVQKYPDPDGRVFAVLEAIQAEYNYIPQEVLKAVAKELQLPLTQLYGVVTFYAGFSLNPKGKHIINICQGTVCHVKGSKLLAETIERELGIKDGETTNDGQFTFQTVRCLGCCSLAPVISIDNEVYANLDRDKLQKLLYLYKEETALDQSGKIYE